MEKAINILSSVGRLDGLPALNEQAIPEILRRWSEDVEVMLTLLTEIKKECPNDGQRDNPAAPVPGS